MKRIFSGVAVATVMAAHSAAAGICDHRLSNYIGSGDAAAAAAGTGAVGGAGAAGSAAGLYTLTHAVTGATMLGSTAGGASAAGTVGIMGGTAGTGAAILGVVLNPFVWVPAAVAAGGLATFEGGCYLFAD